MPATDPARRVLVTGGAGFIGASILLALARRHPAWEIVAFDRLTRRGSELNLPRLKAMPASCSATATCARRGDLDGDRATVDALVEACSAEPSVLAGSRDAAGGRRRQPRRRRQLLRACSGAQGRACRCSSPPAVCTVEALRSSSRSARSRRRFGLIDDRPVPARGCGHLGSVPAGRRALAVRGDASSRRSS